jgi:hypothetical protein
MAQITSATVVILNFTKDKPVVAADSRGSHHASGAVPDDLECKLIQFHHKLLFTSSGAVGYLSPSPSVASWDNVTVAREAVQAATKQDLGKVNMATVSDLWAETIVQNWQTQFGIDREQVIEEAEVGHGVFTVGFFAQARDGEIDWIVEVIKLDSTRLQPITSVSTKELAFCWPCGQPSGKRLCAGGEVDIAAQVCSELDSRKSVGKLLSRAEHGWTTDIDDQRRTGD